MAMSDTERRIEADRNVERLILASKRAEAEGDYRAVAEYDNEIAEWDFWAVHGVSRKAYDEAFAEAND